MQTKDTNSGSGRIANPNCCDPRVSYSRKDGEKFATDLRADLEGQGIPLWQDRVKMEGGRDWWLQIVEALNKVEFMVLVMTPEAMASHIIRKEWRYARQVGLEGTLFPKLTNF